MTDKSRETSPTSNPNAKTNTQGEKVDRDRSDAAKENAAGRDHKDNGQFKSE